MKLIVGLGNPGKEYNNTRHNIGFMCVDNYVDNFSESSKFNGMICETRINNEKVIFLKPTTYMNDSGISVGKIVEYYDIKLEDILVIHDDLDMEVGKVKLKINSSSGGHNGIKSIITHLKSDSFARLKIGISNNKFVSTKEYVLGKFSEEELNILNTTVKETKNIIDSFVSYGLEKTMNEYNKR